MGLDTQFDEGDGDDEGPVGGDHASVEMVKVSSPAGSRDIDHSRTGNSQNKSAGLRKKLHDSSKKSQHAGINAI